MEPSHELVTQWNLESQNWREVNHLRGKKSVVLVLFCFVSDLDFGLGLDFLSWNIKIVFLTDDGYRLEIYVSGAAR